MLNPQIFRKYDIRGIVDKDLTNETVYTLGRAYGSYLKYLNHNSVVIGGDARLSTPRFMKAFTNGLLDSGCFVKDVGIVASPVLYFAIQELKTDAGVMITGSHNPPEYNGFKLNIGLSSIYGKEIEKIRNIISNENYYNPQETEKDFDDNSKKENYQTVKVIIKTYQDNVFERFELKKPLKIVVDAGNGAGGPILPDILKKLNCEVIELFCEMDGNFPNHHPDPTVEEYIQDLMNKVKETKADFGIGLDGDADRIGVVDEKGKMLFGDQILNIFARDYLEENPGKSILADVKCSKNLFDDIKKHNGVPIMYKTGHSLLKSKMQEEGIEVAGEMSGHIFFKDKFYGFDDAIYASVRFAEIIAKNDTKVSKILSDQPKMYNTPEIRIDCEEEKKFKIVEKVKKSFENDNIELNDIDGMRLTFPDGWALVRASNTQPVIVMRFEAETEGRLNEIRKLVEDRIKELS